MLRVAEAVWPKATSARATSCVRKRRFVARVRLPKGVEARTVRARFAGRKVRRAKQVGRKIRATVRVRGTRKRATLKVRVKARGGKTIRRSRTYRLCAARR